MKINFDGIDFKALFLFLILLVFFICKFFIPLIKQFFDAKNVSKLIDGNELKAGGYFEGTNATFPFVVIKLSSSFMYINIKYNNIEFKLFYERIQNIKIYRGIISEGVEITQNDPCFYTTFIIWTPFFKQLAEYLQLKISMNNCLSTSLLRVSKYRETQE